MSRRNKLVKFTEILTFPNVYESKAFESSILNGHNGTKVNLKGQWRKQHFKNNNPLILELACGHGDYTFNLAQRYPEHNFVGVDVKGARIWRGAKSLIENGLNNAAFLRCKIEFIDLFFEKDEVSEIWITFPDPFLKDKKYNRRLTSPAFLERYKKILQPDGVINLKTDSPEFYAHTKEVLAELKIEPIEDHFDIYSLDDLPHPDLDIKTHYEKQHLKDGRLIKFVQFGL